jgi:hypothetical protein
MRWERNKSKHKRITGQEVKIGEREKAINKAIHELIIIKQRRMRESRPEKDIVRVQKEIDRMIRLKTRMQLADTFLKWRDARK